MKLLSISVDELIEALQIFQKNPPTGNGNVDSKYYQKYGNITYGDDGYLFIKNYKETDVPKPEIERLRELGFNWHDGAFVGSEYNPKK